MRCDDFRAFGHDGQALFCEDQKFIFVANLDVFDVRIDGESDVGDQRPGSRCPDEEVRVFFAFDFRFDVDGRILDIAISERYFVRRQRRSAARAVELDLEALIDQSFFEITVQRPPDGFDVLVLAGDVGVLHVDPVAHAPCEVFPHVLVFEDGLAAFGVELGDAVLLDLAFVLQPKLLLDFDFDGQAVRVPAGFAMNLESAHGLIAADQIFDRPGENVVDAGFAVRGRRAFVERVVGRILAGFDAFLEDSVLFPVVENLLFEIRQAHFVGYRLEHPANVARRTRAKARDYGIPER